MEIISDKKGFELEKELIGKYNSKVRDSFFRKNDSLVAQEITPFLDDTSLIDLDNDLLKGSFVHASLFSSAVINNLKRDEFSVRSFFLDNSLLEASDLRRQVIALDKVKDFLDKSGSDNENIIDAKVLVKTAIEKIGKEIKDIEKASLDLDEPMDFIRPTNIPIELPKINNITFADSFNL